MLLPEIVAITAVPWPLLPPSLYAIKAVVADNAVAEMEFVIAVLKTCSGE